MPKISENPVITSVNEATAKLPVVEGGATSYITAANFAADSTFAAVYAALVHAARHKSGGADPIKLDELAAPTDVTTLNASTSAHGLLKKLPNVSTQFMNGQGNWATPAGGSGLASTFDVKDYGAVGDGSTDDTAEIQAALDAATAVGGTCLISAPGTYIVSGSGTLLALDAACTVKIEAGATVKVSNGTGLFETVFGPTNQNSDFTGLRFEGPGTIDCNSVTRAAAAPGGAGANCNGISNFSVGSNIEVRGIRFTKFDSIWCVDLYSSGPATLQNVNVSDCQFDTFRSPTSANGHDHSSIYIDAIGIDCHRNTFWAGAPGLFAYATNYGARTAIELHGHGQHCSHNKVYGMQFGGNACASQNSYVEGSMSGGVNWHDNDFFNVAVGIDIVPYQAGGVTFTTSATLTSGSTYTTISVTALSGAWTPYAKGTYLRLISGANVQLVRLRSAAATGATSLLVDSFVANATYSSGITGGVLYGMTDVSIHHNTITLDSAIWEDTNLQTLELGGIRLNAPASVVCNRVEIVDNNVSFVERDMTAVSWPAAPPSCININMTSGVETNRTILRNWTISRNNIIGSMASGLQLNPINIEGFNINDNIIVDCHSGYTFGYGIYLALPSGAFMYDVTIGRNQILDSNGPGTVAGATTRWGWTSNRLNGAVILDATIKDNVRVIDNIARAVDGTEIEVCNNGGEPVYLRAMQISATWTAPAGNYKQTSTVLLQQPRGGSAPSTPHREQTASGSGATWTGT